jgi:glutamate synthase domain-containing protein 1
MSVLRGEERSSCGVGFLVNRRNRQSHDVLQQGLRALQCVEHRGACSADQVTGDGSGIMTEIPFSLLGIAPGEYAVATMFMPQAQDRMRTALKVFENTFRFYGLEVSGYRTIPVDPSVLGNEAQRTMPSLTHCFIKRPPHCRTDSSFERVLYAARQRTRTVVQVRPCTGAP